MHEYKQVKDLTPESAAYIAGIIDGEGTVSLVKKDKGARRQIVVEISNTDVKLLEFVLSSVGAGRILLKRAYKSHHLPGFTYRIVNRQALQLLEQVINYLRTYKKDRAGLALSTYLNVTPRNGKYSLEQSQAKDAFEKMFFEISSQSKKHVHL